MCVLSAWVALFLLPLLYATAYGEGLKRGRALWIVEVLGFRFNFYMMKYVSMVMVALNAVTWCFDQAAKERLEAITACQNAQRVAFFGDSEFTHWNNLEEDMAAYSKDCYNAGFGGSRTCDLLRHVDMLCCDWRPGIVFLHCGGNDWDYASDKSSETVAELAVQNMRLLIALLRQKDHVQRIHWLLSPRKPIYSDGKWEFMRLVSEQAHTMSKIQDKDTPPLTVLDLTYMAVPDEHLCMDRVHLNAAGHRAKSRLMCQMLLDDAHKK